VRITTAEALDRAVAMEDRFNRLFLRMLRQMRDLRPLHNTGDDE
jgi:hypothetical protein